MTQNGPPFKVRRFTGTGNIAETFTANHPYIIHEIRVKLSNTSAGGETLLTTLDSSGGAAYDHLINSQVMAALTQHRVAGPYRCMKGDAITFAMTNSLSRTYGIEVVYEEIR